MLLGLTPVDAGTDAMVWTLVEPGMAIIASSLATIRPLLRAMKIRGFESTDRNYGTGHSAMHSATKPKPGTMPGFGPEDVSLTHIEPKHDTARSIPNNGLANYSPPRGVSDRPLSPGQQSIVKSEIFVIQGSSSAPSSPWGNGPDDSSTPSFEQIHDLEAHNQDIGRHGYGKRTRQR